MASYANILVYQGADFVTTIEVSGSTSDPIDLTNYTLAGQIRRTHTSLTAYDFEIGIADPEVGIITLELGKDTTSVMKPGRYVYDIFATDETVNKTYKLVEGMFEVVPRVTRNGD